MPKITPNLWFDTEAEEVAAFYVSVFPRSRIVATTHYTEAGPREAGMVMTVAFELDGQRFGMEALFEDPDPDRARRAMEAMLKMGKLDIATLERAADGAEA
jgi:predicted 3-demethylubiquinone-9 3-methyltransferase (glyoxalase superfamily)